jgi:hypothetical protein
MEDSLQATLAARFPGFAASAGAQVGEHVAPVSPQQFSVKYPTSPFITVKSAE